MEKKNINLSSDIILFHSEGEEHLKKLILYDINYRVFDPVNDVVYNFFQFSRSIPKSLYKNLGVLVKSVWLLRNFKNLLRKIRAQIISDQLRDLNPKVVITFNDNSTVFHLVSEVCDDMLFLAIQNGGRYSWCASDALPDQDLKYNIDEYFCFGPQVERLFSKTGHNIKKYINCGSLLGGYFFSTILSSNIKINKKHDICLVSQWKQHIINADRLPKQWMRLGEAIIILTEYMARYASEYNKKVCVALRSNDPAEREFYDELFKKNCVFQESNRLSFSSYLAAADSNLIVALNSTMASETFGMGLKVLFVNPHDEKWLQPTTNDGVWYLSKPSYESFSMRVEGLLEMSQDEYLFNAEKEMKICYVI